MTRTRTVIVSLIAAASALLLAPQQADARDRCHSHFSWGGHSYFGDRWIYPQMHAYPRTMYRSSRHFIYVRRVPHFYSSVDAPHSNYYRSPWYDSYYRFGPDYDAWRYDRDPDRRYPQRLWKPYCPDDGDDGERYNREYESDPSAQPQSSEVLRTPAAPVPPNFEKPAATAQVVADRRGGAQQRELAEAGRERLDRAWKLLAENDARGALPAFAEAAMLRSSDAQPRLGYGLAAAASGQELVASWAIRRSLSADPHVMTELPSNGALRETLAGVFEDYATVDEGPAEQVRDRLVIAATLAVLLGNDEVMQQSLTRLLEMDERDTVRTLAVAARHTLRARLQGDEPKDLPAEFMASKPAK